MNNKKRELDQLRALSALMDSKFEGPFGIKFGLDALVGFIPVLGDFLTTGISLYIIIQAANLGCDVATLLRMGLNLLVDTVVDTVPFLGNFVDIFWKANNKNISLLESHVNDPRGVTFSSRMVVFGICFFIMACLAVLASVTVFLIKWIFT